MSDAQPDETSTNMTGFFTSFTLLPFSPLPPPLPLSLMIALPHSHHFSEAKGAPKKEDEQPEKEGDQAAKPEIDKTAEKGNADLPKQESEHKTSELPKQEIETAGKKDDSEQLTKKEIEKMTVAQLNAALKKRNIIPPPKTLKKVLQELLMKEAVETKEETEEENSGKRKARYNQYENSKK
jgi:hypothetical protein